MIDPVRSLLSLLRQHIASINQLWRDLLVSRSLLDELAVDVLKGQNSPDHLEIHVDRGEEAYLPRPLG